MPQEKRRVVRVLITLPEDTLQRLDEVAAKLSVPRSALIRIMVVEALDRREPEAPKPQ
jgi:metal-responsive CopG/Arc/MetJ family transcriptional regulator